MNLELSTNGEGPFYILVSFLISVFSFFWFSGVPRTKGKYMRIPLGIIPGANPRANARPCLPAFHLVRRRRQFRDLDFGLIQS